MSKKRIAVVGAGNMARTRGRAFIDTGRAEICAVASRRTASARACAAELECNLYFDDYRRLAETRPDAMLIELPHKPQDEVALWALEEGFDLLIGGPLASNPDAGKRIVELAASRNCLVEAGYQRRYDAAWEEIRRLVHSGDLGAPVMAVSMALWNATPQAWYCDQELSGGMPLTHMSYCYLNAIRWILGEPIAVAAANCRVGTAPGRVVEETCGALVHFAGGAFLSATASYIGPQGLDDARTRFVCAEGGVLVDEDSIIIFRQGQSERLTFSELSPFTHQAEVFLDALDSRDLVRNPPADALVDVQLAVAISASAAERCSIALN